ncbi:MAG TPA: mechanosensitive ion channel family protein [Saprospiraceae bacterium]|nr:mechanosensitive ion channel family protein [Saprospiraceae bacterium]HMQ83405.1 mechanosensitive ion channel family protein [Saprospiraceae bacterium]
MDQELLAKVEYIGIFLGIVIGTIVLGTIVNRIFVRLIRRSTSELKNDPTNYKFLRRVVVTIIYIVGFSVALYNMPSMRALANSLLAGAGILAVAAGFASQHALGNIISGLFIIIFRPFRVNDRLKVRELNGVVEDITLRHTVIRDFENRRIIIPNSIISEEIIVNADFSDEKICKWIDIGISYDSDIALARKIIKEEVLKHPLNIDPRTPEQLEKGTELVPVRVLSLGEFSVNLRAWAWANNSADAFNMGCDLLESIKNRFDREGIEIPFPYRTLVYKEKKATATPTPTDISKNDRLEIY